MLLCMEVALGSRSVKGMSKMLPQAAVNCHTIPFIGYLATASFSQPLVGCMGILKSTFLLAPECQNAQHQRGLQTAPASIRREIPEICTESHRAPPKNPAESIPRVPTSREFRGGSRDRSLRRNILSLSAAGWPPNQCMDRSKKCVFLLVASLLSGHIILAHATVG